MCRIAGALSPSLQKQELDVIVNKMCFVQKHGGPDGNGTYSNPAFNGVLGHCRLSIIDLSDAGQQPMSYSHRDNNYTITYNGEIYNYQELKKSLKNYGYAFSSNSDTEMIMAAYDKWGENAFELFSGMFAFALLDHSKNELILARDVSGIKPLYYANTTQLFAFASEVRALKQVPQLNNENPDWQVHFMAYGHLPEPVTTLKEVTPLAKGSYLVYDIARGRTTTSTFDRLSYLEKTDSHKQAIELIKQKFSQAIERHLVSDAPLGVFLSGGLDSSVIAMLAAKQTTLSTVSLHFENSLYSEKKYQDELVKQLSCEHHSFLLTEENFHQSLPGIIKAMDLPCCDGINTWYISRFAKESGLKTVLSGIGGDELFGGYPSFSRIKMASLLAKMPGKLLRASSKGQSKRFRRLGYLSINGAVGKYLFLRGHFIPSDIAAHLGMDEAAVWQILEETPLVPGIDYLSYGNQASWLETNLYMQNQLLRDADVMSMAHGLEIRVPFLDKEFLKTVFAISSNIKYQGKNSKQLLVDAFGHQLPASIWNRPKMGFSFPFTEWFANSRYAATGNREVDAAFIKFKEGKLHWSHFFTLMLLASHNNE
ncbi:MAG TPA: asparagine synthase (glutamine-hydrolyzing) [Ferruginibacter sp.]|nr:asparagine synthase (glutamine-hydrolyzing) [Ferruginibacter sp.]